jgi:hypothetical protein
MSQDVLYVQWRTFQDAYEYIIDSCAAYNHDEVEY